MSNKADPDGSESATASGSRQEPSTVRDQAAAERDELARDRDLAAAERNRVAALRDEHARRPGYDLADARSDREWSAVDRTLASRDRDRSAQDRDRSAQDRALAAEDMQALTFDRLTNARQRGPGLDELQRAIDRALRTKQPLAVAYVDVDGLKVTNDSQGHAAGDEMLKNVANALRSDLRSYDSIVRLGGDEFLCVFPGVGIAGARSALAHAANWIVESDVKGSFSVGFAELEPQDSPEGLVARADQDLITKRGQDPW
jgi:diguanylate cyclase (GGDEF)-like protein